MANHQAVTTEVAPQPIAVGARLKCRSDWPEAGLPGSWAPLDDASPSGGESWQRAVKAESADAILRLCACRNDFESDLYGLTCVEVRLEVEAPLAASLAPTDEINAFVSTSISAWHASARPGPAYVYARTLRTEPLYEALRHSDFDEIEDRRLYQCRIADLNVASSPPTSQHLRYATLAEVDPGRQQAIRDQILVLCRESFRSGSSRHFRDKLLSDRLAGQEYIAALMKHNFQRLPAEAFLVALDVGSGTLVGFTVVGRKPALQQQTFTQLLSAVEPSYRGHGVYRGMSKLLRDTLPGDARLLNVTHVQNAQIQRAYESSGRVHVADTVVLRRLLGAASR